MTYHPTRGQIVGWTSLRRGKDVEKEGAVAVDGRTAAGVAAAIAPVAIIAVLFPPALFLLSSTFNSFSLPRKCFYDRSVLTE